MVANSAISVPMSEFPIRKDNPNSERIIFPSVCNCVTICRSYAAEPTGRLSGRCQHAGGSDQKRRGTKLPDTENEITAVATLEALPVPDHGPRAA